MDRRAIVKKDLREREGLKVGKKNNHQDETLVRKKNYNSKREDIEEEDQREDERNVIL